MSAVKTFVKWNCQMPTKSCKHKTNTLYTLNDYNLNNKSKSKNKFLAKKKKKSYNLQKRKKENENI